VGATDLCNERSELRSALVGQLALPGAQPASDELGQESAPQNGQAAERSLVDLRVSAFELYPPRPLHAPVQQRLGVAQPGAEVAGRDCVVGVPAREGFAEPPNAAMVQLLQYQRRFFLQAVVENGEQRPPKREAFSRFGDPGRLTGMCRRRGCAADRVSSCRSSSRCCWALAVRLRRASASPKAAPRSSPSAPPSGWGTSATTSAPSANAMAMHAHSRWRAGPAIS
jgi:hypothetical protein